MNHTITYYSTHAEQFAKQYESTSFEQVHKEWIKELPQDGVVLDVGAGSGRDARFMASKGLSVVAVEPATGIREQAQSYNIEQHSIQWLSDTLPELRSVFGLQIKFDLILLSAVWMHVPTSQRQRAFRKLSTLLKPNGKLIISLRHGPCGDERIMYSVSADEIASLAQENGLIFQLLSNDAQEDVLARSEVTWQTVMCTLPDDGTGAFPLLRNIVVNDNKSSTYKLALLRSLLRIAEGHPGAVLECSDKHVVLPLGLVALYWLRLYKPLIDDYDIRQSSSKSKGLGFVKASGWKRLTELKKQDFTIGAMYLDDTLALPLFQTLKDICVTIRDMPAKYITLPHSDKAVFDVETYKMAKPKSGFVLDSEFFSGFGRFVVPRHVWESLSGFSVWIEPALVNEWANLMQSYQVNKQQHSEKTYYLKALQWESAQRTTVRVRERVDSLLNNEQVCCCWSGATIKRSRYAIDHAFPFSRWPNNDLWNLLPATVKVNAEKSDKLPTNLKLSDCRALIIHWWQQGWDGNQQEFFTQANLALPNLSPKNRNYDDVFEAFALQRNRIRHIQQLREWGA